VPVATSLATSAARPNPTASATATRASARGGSYPTASST
jgi:hypothetical protein